MFEYIERNPGLTALQILEKFPTGRKELSELVKSKKIYKKVYCFGSGGFDGLGFRTRPWTYIYFCSKNL